MDRQPQGRQLTWVKGYRRLHVIIKNEEKASFQHLCTFHWNYCRRQLSAERLGLCNSLRYGAENIHALRS